MGARLSLRFPVGILDHPGLEGSGMMKSDDKEMSEGAWSHFFIVLPLVRVERFVRTVLYIFTCQEKVMAWLDEQQLVSRQVLYVAFGSEVDSVECSCKQW